MLGIFSNMMKVATRTGGITHEDRLQSHQQRKREEEMRWKAHQHWFQRNL